MNCERFAFSPVAKIYFEGPFLPISSDIARNRPRHRAGWAELLIVLRSVVAITVKKNVAGSTVASILHAYSL